MLFHVRILQSIVLLSQDTPFSNEYQSCGEERVEPQLRECASPRGHGNAIWLARIDGDSKSITDDFDFD